MPIKLRKDKERHSIGIEFQTSGERVTEVSLKNQRVVELSTRYPMGPFAFYSIPAPIICMRKRPVDQAPIEEAKQP